MSENSFDLALILPDGTELSYGPVSPGTLPDVGEVITFQRSDPEGKLIPDEDGLEYKAWVVASREWSVRLTARYSVTFLILRLAEPTTSEESQT